MKNVSLYLPLIDTRVSMVRVVFESNGKPYTYKCDIRVEVGDLVVVEARNWYQVVRVVDVDLPLPIEDDDTDYRWVVCAVETRQHDMRKQEEDVLIAQVTKARVNDMRERILTGMGLSPDTVRRLRSEVLDDDDVIEDEDDD